MRCEHDWIMEELPMTTVAEQLRNILTEKFSVPEERVQPGAKLEDLGLDSLDMIEVLFEVEDAFNIRVPEDGTEIRSATIQDLLDTVKRLVEEQQASAAAGAPAMPEVRSA
jgi:acyl carrier protein